MFVFTVVLASAVLGHDVPAALADQTLCPVAPGVQPGAITIVGDVLATAGCDLTNTTVLGDVNIAPGGSLIVAQGSTTQISGDVSGKNILTLEIRSGSVGGDVHIDGVSGPWASVILGFGDGSSPCTVPRLTPVLTVNGHVRIEHAASANVIIESTQIGRDLTANDNALDSPFGILGALIVCESTIGGGVTARNNTASDSSGNFIAIFRNSIDKDLRVRDNALTGPASSTNAVEIFANQVGKSMRLINNSAVGVGAQNIMDVEDNTIAKYLDCRNNTPAPTDTIGTGSPVGNTFKMRNVSHNGSRNRNNGGQCAELRVVESPTRALDPEGATE